MSRAGLIVAGALVGLSAWVWWYGRQLQAQGYRGPVFDGMGVLNETAQAIGTAAQDLTEGFFMRVNDMRQVTAADLAHGNVQAFLRVIRRGEGTADADGYRRIFGGQLFNDFSDHPRILVKKSGYSSTAAGAYQFIVSSWDETARIMGLKDFTPASQDLAAVGRIKARGALDDVKAGRFEQAIKKCAREWASLPFSPYGQPTISLNTAKAIYTAHNGRYEGGATV